jgi:hypothetical protein
MSSPEFYIQQARHCFDMATMTRDPAARQRWIDRANEYLMQADALGEPSPQLPLPDTHSQPMQQQQQRAEDTPSDSKEDP